MQFLLSIFWIELYSEIICASLLESMGAPLGSEKSLGQGDKEACVAKALPGEHVEQWLVNIVLQSPRLYSAVVSNEIQIETYNSSH